MNVKTMTMWAVGLAVAAIMFGGLIVPVTNAAQHSADTTYNNPINTNSRGEIYTFDENSEDVTVITICNNSTRTFTINGNTYSAAGWQPMVVSDACSVRYYSNTLTFASPEGSHTLTEGTITISKGVASFDLKNNATSISVPDVPISWAYLYTPNGSYSASVVESTPVERYAHIGDLYSANWITTTNEYFSIKGDVATITKGDATRTESVNFGGEYLEDGVYKLTLGPDSTDYTFVVDNAGSDYTVHPFLIAYPIEVVGTPDDQSANISLLGVIPLMFIIAIVMFAASAIYNRRA